MENATLSIKGFEAYKPVLVVCTLGHHDDERLANGIRMCLNDMDTDGSLCALTRNLPPDVVVENSSRSPSEGRIIINLSVWITNPNRREVDLWCCYVGDNETIVADMENYRLVKTQSEDDLEGK